MYLINLYQAHLKRQQYNIAISCIKNTVERV
nr:MAG TPA: hypothetical protein [Bacteriophage sp.]